MACRQKKKLIFSTTCPGSAQSPPDLSGRVYPRPAGLLARRSALGSFWAGFHEKCSEKANKINGLQA